MWSLTVCCVHYFHSRQTVFSFFLAERYSFNELEQDLKVMFVALFKRWERVQFSENRLCAVCAAEPAPVWSIYKYIISAHCSQPHALHRVSRLLTKPNHRKIYQRLSLVNVSYIYSFPFFKIVLHPKNCLHTDLSFSKPLFLHRTLFENTFLWPKNTFCS